MSRFASAGYEAMGLPQSAGNGGALFMEDACMALQHRLGKVPEADRGRINDRHRQLSRAPLSHFAELALSMAGQPAPQFCSQEELFERALRMDGSDRYNASASDGAYNRPGSFPNLLSNLANKILDAAIELNQPTYEEWTGEWPGDLPDFKPGPIVNRSQADELDEVMDAEASQEFGLDEEMLAYMVLGRFSNKFSLTPVMAAADDLGAFAEGLLGLENAWENRQNRTCIRLLTGNVTLLDGYALYDDTNHGNDMASGAAPSDAQFDTMNQKVAAQRGIGGKGYVRTPLSVALVPPALWRQATQSFAAFQILGESKVATTDANVNVYRGRVTVVREPELQTSSSVKWYGFARPQGMANAAIIRAYFRGWGKNGRRQRWYDPATKVWNFELEGRFGAAAKQYRFTVRNPGQ